MFTWNYWKATLERLIGTYAAAFVGLAVVDEASNYVNLNWGNIAYTSAVITGMTFIKALAAFAANGTPGFTKAEQLTPDKE